jgi:hypothetical protein
MNKNQSVRHKRCGSLVFRIVSPPEKNGGKIMICVATIRGGLTDIIVTDIPENFY